ncbi:hypothetical protein AWZ03_014183 [Drosophila navojoa]|uniref:C-type lectin domain-containing protein n=1 Tax=Drosophila navojoa TaxID=7232 RepID=A0A484ASG6_DRONA|nr:C-type lectin 37Da-like [Drosophila navojoa]TDG39396.1 hypothetical protein AWZ03_014183 [Drosophila navojoa]
MQFKMQRYSVGLFLFSGFLFVCSWAYTITPIVHKGFPTNTDVTTAPFVKIGNGYYYFENTTTRNWFDAFTICRQMNAHLISIETNEEWSLIMNYRRSVRDTNRYWTSGTDLGAEGSHVWFATGKPINLNLWTVNNPDNYKNNEHCDELGWRPSKSAAEGLNDCSCSARLRYICEAPEPQTASFIIW